MVVSERAQAACTANVTNLNFGNINPVDQTGYVDVTATINYDCSSSLSLLSYINVCIQIGKGPLDSDVGSRLLGHADNTETLLYNVYSDPNHTSIWGDVFSLAGIPPKAEVVQHGPYTLVGRAQGSKTIYGRLAASNAYMQKKIGYYASTLPVTVRSSSVTLLGLLSCTGTPEVIPLNVSVNLLKACTISATPLSFGSHPSNFSSAVQSTSAINTACSKGTFYQIGLDNGKNPSGNTRRMKAADGSYINYELYNNPARTQRWGTILHTSEVVQGTSTGLNQQATVYGQVQPQAGLKAATYQDTITVTVSY